MILKFQVGLILSYCQKKKKKEVLINPNLLDTKKYYSTDNLILDTFWFNFLLYMIYNQFVLQVVPGNYNAQG